MAELKHKVTSAAC